MRLAVTVLTVLMLVLAGCRQHRTRTVAAQESTARPATGNAGLPAARGVGVQWKSYTTSANYNLEERTGQHTIQLTGQLDLPADEEILAVSAPRIIEALDEEGRSLVSTPRGPALPLPAEIAAAFGTQAAPYEPRFEVHGHLGRQPRTQFTVALTGFPSLPRSIRQLRGEVHVLRIVEKHEQTVALENLRDLVEPVEKFAVRLAPESWELLRSERRAPAVTQRVPVTLRVRRPARSAHYDPRFLLEAPVILSFALLDADGRALDSQDMNFTGVTPTGDGQVEFAITQYVTMAADRPVKSIRLTLATATDVYAVPFSLADVPVP